MSKEVLTKNLKIIITDQKPENPKHGKQNTTSKPGTAFVVRKTS